MNFQNLKSIEEASFYIGLAFSKAKKDAEKLRETVKAEKMDKSRIIELARLTAVRDVLSSQLNKIIMSYPNVDELPDFYRELVKCTVDYVLLKKSFGAVKWAIEKVQELARNYSLKIKRCYDLTKINDYRREFFGRVSSVMRQVNKNLKFLEESRKIMKSYPNIKTSLSTIAVVGFPNVGKTTLLYKLTGSKPEINSYAFTTKCINVGNIEVNHEKVQVLDTPGTLDRFNKMNNIERQAYLAMKYCASFLIYVFDLTEESYPLICQMKLYDELKKTEKPILAYLSKTDILDKKVVERFKLKYYSLEELRKELDLRVSKPA